MTIRGEVNAPFTFAPKPTMSGHSNRPFGRTLPAAHTPLPESFPPTNRPEPRDHPYQLPPPRIPSNLPFVSGQTPGQCQNTESSHQGRDWTSTGSSPPHQRCEQLPSVRQLLTPATDSTLLPLLSQSFALPAPSIEHRDLCSFSHQEPCLAQQRPLITSEDRVKSRSESLPQIRTNTLPPLSQAGRRELKHPALARSESWGSLFPSNQSARHGSPYHVKAMRREPSSSETARLSNRPAVSATLHHVVGEKYMEGEGLCYIYADGSHCRKVINGIPVNANWGVTKAGKPRKRLAQACLTCREKKIKCQPNLPKCDQCRKHGRECRFENA